MSATKANNNSVAERRAARAALREKRRHDRAIRRSRLRAARRKANKAIRSAQRAATHALKKMRATLKWRREHPYQADPRGLGMRIRTRETEPDSTGYTLMGRAYWFANSNPPWAYGANLYAYSPLSTYGITQEYCMDELHAGPPWRDGGPFFHFKKKMPLGQRVNLGTYYSLNGQYKYVGGFFVNYTPPTNWDIAFTDREVSYVVDGTKGWNRFKPGRPGATLGQALGEARDIPRMLQTSAYGFHNLWRSARAARMRGFNPHSVADHYLNHMFGWVPFVNDIRRMLKTYMRLEKDYNFLIENNNSWIRRGGTVSNDVSSDIIAGDENHTAHIPLMSSYYYSDPTKTGRYQVRRKRVHRTWFSAKFKYYVPDIRSIEFRRWYLQQVFGAHVTPSLIYELTPWSWLADWFSNAGDVVSGLLDPNLDNLTAQYAYVMGKTEDEYSVESCHNLAGIPLVATLTFSCKHETREKASPFGFGLTPGDLTWRQSSILAALGLSRLHW